MGYYTKMLLKEKGYIMVDVEKTKQLMFNELANRGMTYKYLVEVYKFKMYKTPKYCIAKVMPYLLISYGKITLPYGKNLVMSWGKSGTRVEWWNSREFNIVSKKEWENQFFKLMVESL